MVRCGAIAHFRYLGMGKGDRCELEMFSCPSLRLFLYCGIVEFFWVKNYIILRCETCCFFRAIENVKVAIAIAVFHIFNLDFPKLLLLGFD